MLDPDRDGIRRRLDRPEPPAGRSVPARPRVRLWRGVRYWQELFVYLWFTALVANWLEFALKGLIGLLAGDNDWWWPLRLAGLFTFQEPYALGAAAVILIVIPLKERFGLGHGVVFLLSAALASAVELISGGALMLALGRNSFWDYSGRPLSFDGQTSLASAAVFGALAMVFIYLVYPATVGVLRGMRPRRMNLLLGLMLVVYVAALLTKLAAIGSTP